jgi:hypothetical protein
MSRDERDAVAPEGHETAGHHLFDPAGDPDGLRDIGEVVQRDPDGLGRDRHQLTVQRRVPQYSQIHDPHLVTRVPCGSGHPFQAQRLQPRKDL